MKTPQSFVFEEKISQGNHMINNHDVIVYETFSPTLKNAKPVFSNSSGLKSVFENPRVLDGSVKTVGPGVEIKQRF